MEDLLSETWFMSVHLEVTQAAAHRAVNGQRRSAASSGGQQCPAAVSSVQRRSGSGSEEASGWRPHQ